ncbi:ferric reductase-like transmembrane domain-containing protein [Desulfococcaceae bacterium OttesenSCG-928-F15]|nr:ferric reductase-like transmembrane domain-containing protein [Desulfococcaceae bacterium OttesenSCG-928-F15]
MKKWMFGIIGLAALVWIMELPEGFFSDLDIWTARRQTILFTGFVAYLMMAWVMVLSLRLSMIESRLGGLDRVYRLHKWLGICASSLGIFHWAAAQIPKWLVGAGILERPARHGSAVEGINWKEIAEVIGEWTFYFVLFLVILALVRKFPYHKFRRLHKLMAPAFFLFTFHALILFPLDRLLSPAGILAMLAAVSGILAAFWSLFRVIGSGRRYRGIVRHIEPLSDDVLHLRCEMEYQGMPYVAGQFVFARFEGTRDPHPFTISSSFLSSKVISFYIKVLGDDTRFLMEHLQKNSTVQIEGPYGQFDFVDNADTRDQIWVGAGIGVTPFLARMEVLTAASQDDLYDGPRIHFYYCSQPENALLKPVETLALSIGARFEVHDEFVQGPLKLEDILKEIHAPKTAQLWFCGPTALGNSLEKAWRKKRLPMKNFHREYFEMR